VSHQPFTVFFCHSRGRQGQQSVLPSLLLQPQARHIQGIERKVEMAAGSEPPGDEH